MRTEKIWKKDDFFNIKDGRLDMDQSLVELPEPEETWPLVWQFEWDKVIGKITNIRREDEEIVGDIEIKDDIHYEVVDGVATGVHTDNYRSMLYDMLDAGEVRLGGHYSNVLWKDSVMVVAKLTAVAVVLEPING